VPPLRQKSAMDRHTARGASSPFHIALLSSKTCGFSHHANLEIRVTRCQLLSVVKELSFRSSVSDRNVSAPGGAHWRFGAATAIQNCPKIKNPASSAGHVRPLDVAAFYPRSLPDAYARSSFFWFPVFVTNPTSAFDSRPGPSGESPTNYGATDIATVYLFSGFRQVFADYFL